MVGGLARPDDELPARVAMPSPPRAFTPRFLLAFCRHDHSERETTASEARRGEARRDEARRGARFPRITASRETWSRRNRTERQRSAANRLRSASRLPFLDARSSPRGGHTGLVFFSSAETRCRREIGFARAQATARLLLARSRHAPFSLRSPRRRDRQRNRRLDSRSSQPLDNFAHANRDDATDAPTTRSFRMRVYFCSMREAFRKRERYESTKRFRPRLVSLVRFKRKIARYVFFSFISLLLKLCVFINGVNSTIF